MSDKTEPMKPSALVGMLLEETAGQAAGRSLGPSPCEKIVDIYGLALMMIRKGAANPIAIAREALDKANLLRPL